MPFSHQYAIINVKTDRIMCQIRFTDHLLKFLDPCVVPYLVVTLTLYHVLLHLKMKENDPILVYYYLSLSDVQACNEKET